MDDRTDSDGREQPRDGGVDEVPGATPSGGESVRALPPKAEAPSPPSQEIPERKPLGLPLLALLLATASLVALAAAGCVGYRRSLQSAEGRLSRFYLAEARLLAREAEIHGHSSDDEALGHIADLWACSPNRPDDEYACVIDGESRLILHTRRPALVGRDVGANTVLGSPGRSPCRLRDLHFREDHVGGYVSSQAERQIAAFARVPSRRWVVGVHRSRAALLSEARAGIAPIAVGLGFCAGILVPLSLALLYWAFQTSLRTQRRMAAALRESEAKYRRYIESAPSAVFVVDRTGACVQVNKEACRLTGYSNSELLAMSLLDLAPPEEREKSRLQFASLSESGRALGEMSVLNKDGTHVWVSLNAVRVASGCYIAICTDLTDRRRAEQALRESEERFRQLAANIDIVFWLVSLDDGRVLYVSPAYETVWGRGCESLKDNADEWLEAVHQDDRGAVVEAREAQRRGEQLEEERAYRVVRPDGAVRWVRERSFPVRDEDGRVSRLGGTCEDVTLQRRMEQERRDLEAGLRHQQKLESIGTLAGGVAHEINNPINGVMNYAQLIEDDLAKLDDRGVFAEPREYARGIIEETKRVATIVRNLLAFARQEGQQEKVQASLPDMIDSTLSLVRTVIRHDQIRLEVDIADDLPFVRCRSHEIRQVLMNLMTNARDALNERHAGYHEDKLLRVTARSVAKDGSVWVSVCVEDRGVGIPADVRERMFDPFYTTKEPGRGTGLGLSISHGIVRDHGGEMHVESEPGQWTRVALDLPAAQ